MTKFSNFFSLEQYQAIINIHLEEQEKKNTESKEIDFKAIFKVEESFGFSIFKYLQEKTLNKTISMPKNSETHNSNFLKNFQDFIDNKINENNYKTISRIFKNILRENTSLIIYNPGSISVDDSYNNLIKSVDKGDFDYFYFKVDSECSCCGKKIEMQSKNWNLELIEVDYLNSKDNSIKQLPACLEDKLYQVKVEFKTGEILIADWFRIDEFTKKVKYNKDYEDISINFDLGQIKSTEHAANLGFVTVHVGNNSPNIFKNGNEFLFGHTNYEETQDDIINGYHENGSVCTDLWNVTIIDKSRLIEIISEKSGKEEAIKIVSQYLKENDVYYTTIEPGEYLIEFNPRNSINKYNKEVPQDINCVFSMQKIKLKKKLKP